MKWISVNEPNTTVRVFNLVENNLVKEELRYHPVQRSARLTGIETKRVFFAEKAGFRNNHFIIKNEYGFENARVYLENLTGDSGYIETEQGKTQFTFIQGKNPELVIYEEDGITPAVMCGLQKSPDTTFASTNFSPEDICLLWGLYWYVFNNTILEQPGFSKRLEAVS